MGVLKKIIGRLLGKKETGGTQFSQNLERSGYMASHQERGKRQNLRSAPWFTSRKPGFSVTDVPSGASGGNKVRGILKIALFGGFLLAGSCYLLAEPIKSLYGNLNYFRVHEIELQGIRTIGADELKKYGGISYELNVLTLDTKVLAERLMTHPWVKHAEVQRVWPDGLMIAIKEHQPRALVVSGDEQLFSYVDRDALVFAQAHPGQELDYPVITGIGPQVSEQEMVNMLGAANMILRFAERNNPNLPAQNISEIHFASGGEVVLYLVEHPFPIYFGRNEIKKKYYQLCRVLEVLYRKHHGAATIENVSYIRMDYQENKVLVVRNHAG